MPNEHSSRYSCFRKGWNSNFVLTLTDRGIAGVFLLAALGPGCGYRPTPEAAGLYSQGVAALQEGADYRASQALERAVAADPKFAMARGRLAEAYFELDLSAKAPQYRETVDYVDRGRAY